MEKIFLDKFGSVTKNVPLKNDVAISPTIAAEEGAVLAVEVLEDKKTYNQLELVSRRMSVLKKSDRIAVALGSRRALRGFVGEVPKTLKVGDTINVLNMGGVAGICTSENIKEVGHALRVKVLGSICNEANGHPLNIKDHRLFEEKEHLSSVTPLIIVSGTCMNVGKTSVASEIIKQGTHHGFKMMAAKLAGVAALRDTENMTDYGAKLAVSFLDAGYSSTVGLKSVTVTKGAVEYLSSFKPDYIVIEFGDGILGEYGVYDILCDPEIQKQIIAHVGCANDPPGALKLAEICAQIGAPIDVISGPVTDNSVGSSFIKNTLKLPAFNGLTQGEDLFNHLASTCLKR